MSIAAQTQGRFPHLVPGNRQREKDAKHAMCNKQTCKTRNVWQRGKDAKHAMVERTCKRHNIEDTFGRKTRNVHARLLAGNRSESRGWGSEVRSSELLCSCRVEKAAIRSVFRSSIWKNGPRGHVEVSISNGSGIRDPQMEYLQIETLSPMRARVVR